MHNFNLNHLAILIAVLVMLLIAAGSGYRLQLSSDGLLFERNLPNK
jgi:hypothetical protein